MPDPELADRIAAMADEGLNIAEIGVRLALTPKQVRRLANHGGVRWPRGGVRRIGAELPFQRYRTLADLAAQAQVSPAVMMTRIATVALEEGVTAAARRLGTLARPKRAYVRRRQEASASRAS